MMSFFKGLLNKPKPLAAKLLPESQFVVVVNAVQVVCRHLGEDPQIVTWKDLKLVSLLTNNQGPWLCDVYWHLLGDRSECFIPQGASGEKSLIEALKKLPDFDNEQMYAAMRCTENKQFVCWQRK